MLLLLHRLTLIISPLPKNGQNCRPVLLKPFVKWAQGPSLSGEICPENFCAIGFFFNDRFLVKFDPNFSAKFPPNRPFFPRICLWKSHEIWLFFRDLSEALCYERFT